MCVCVCVCVYIYIYIYMCVYTYMHTHIPTHMYARISPAEALMAAGKWTIARFCHSNFGCVSAASNMYVCDVSKWGQLDKEHKY